jgi:ABC-type lipopolysaccharide export system ATPase subunit
MTVGKHSDHPAREYYNLCAVHDISLEIDQGQIPGLSGPGGTVKITIPHNSINPRSRIE